MRTLCVHRENIAYIALVFALAAPAQTVMGTVSTHDAQITGGLQVQNERASLVSNAAITAYDHAAPIALSRGGEVLVCATSQFHLLHSGTGNALLFGLDRGALELHGNSDPQDVILTPDIRFTLEAPGTYDLRLRVTANGDTCVHNAGSGPPVLILNDAFSAASYRLIPGQHVLFEHGSLREVVDNERSSCGCPAEKPATSVADAAHPFPAAASAGLAPVQPPANSTPGETHAQITTTLAYNPGQPAAPDATTAAVSNPAASGTTSAEPPQTPPGAHDLAHAIGHFFHKLFHPGDSTAAKN